MSDRKKALPAVLIIYLACFVLRVLEYFVLRTDQTVLGEALLHKLMGVAILFAAAKALAFKPRDLGFTRDGAIRGWLKGLALGMGVFAVAYLAEALMAAAGGGLRLEVYVSAYTVESNVGRQTGFMFFALCVAGNVVNVVMEEGVFRGLFQKLLERRYTFAVAAVIASLLFGLWHVVGPVRSYVDGQSSLGGFIANVATLTLSSGLVGFKLCLLTRLTGSLYMAMGDHFVNNTIVNVLHMVTDTGADELMFVRITIAQTLSFVVVLIWYLRDKKKPLSVVDRG